MLMHIFAKTYHTAKLYIAKAQLKMERKLVLPNIDRRAETVLRSMPGLFGDFRVIAYSSEEAECTVTVRVKYDRIFKLVCAMKNQFQLELLYHHSPSTDTDYGEECCAFCRPGLGASYTIRARSNGRGEAETVSVTVYDDENIGGMLLAELEKRLTYGRMWECIARDTLLTYFC